METTKVGIREFRSDMAEYIASSTPVAITRHGQTVGFFIPTHNHAESDVAALKRASTALERLLTAHAVDIDAVVGEFKVARKKKAVRRKSAAKAA